MTEKRKIVDKTAASRVAKMENRHRERGLVQRKRWAHPDDWPAIDAYMKRLEREREGAG